VEELRALYRKALPEQEPPLVEAVSDGAADGQAGEAAAENLSQVAEPLVEVAVRAEPARAEDEAPEPGEPATVEVSIVAASQPARSVPAGAHSLLFPRSAGASRSNPKRDGLVGRAARGEPSPYSQGGKAVACGSQSFLCIMSMLRCPRQHHSRLRRCCS
jgi:hypothetical protein